MHINTELLESVYFVSSMLIEVPFMVQNPQAAFKVSRQFRRALHNHAHQLFAGIDVSTASVKHQINGLAFVDVVEHVDEPEDVVAIHLGAGTADVADQLCPLGEVDGLDQILAFVATRVSGGEHGGFRRRAS